MEVMVDAMPDVPGARIYSEARGSGPILLLLPGGDGDADAFDALAAYLEPVFTVLAHPRPARPVPQHLDRVPPACSPTPRTPVESWPP
jgi:hypothetical protein